MSDMKILTTRELSRRTASVLDALESGQTFELRRNGKAVGYLTQQPPTPERKPNWKAHFDWFRAQRSNEDSSILAEFEEDRRRLRAREKALGNRQ
jgi:antitoxin (DNA-binding transcriptional repressor) of toxin-antitoxin stability system